ncbi:peptidoglycan editing factor PgeF [soil metagenome]
METYGELLAVEGLGHGFVTRVAGVDVGGARDEMRERLWENWVVELGALGFGESQLWTAGQVHGARVEVVPQDVGGRKIAETDGLVTGEAGVLLGIMVADCCAVYVVDPVVRACGLLHSGRKGSELGIAAAGIQKMEQMFGSDPADLLVRLSPCIRPPDFEVDFAAAIRDQCVAAGVLARNVHDDGISTSADLGRYYSYRMEKGRTGRMLALLGFR